MASIKWQEPTEGRAIAERTYGEVAALQEDLAYYRAYLVKEAHQQTRTDAEIRQLRKEVINLISKCVKQMKVD